MLSIIAWTSVASIMAMSVLWLLVWSSTRFRPRPNRRGMFVLNDGKSIRHVDPISVLSSLNSHPEFKLDTHPMQARNGNAQAIRICIDAIQSAFGVQKYSSPKQPGLTTVEMLALLDAFQVYCMGPANESKNAA